MGIILYDSLTFRLRTLHRTSSILCALLSLLAICTQTSAGTANPKLQKALTERAGFGADDRTDSRIARAADHCVGRVAKSSWKRFLPHGWTQNATLQETGSKQIFGEAPATDSLIASL